LREILDTTAYKLYIMNMKVIFTDHAKLRMEERGITIDDVCKALQNPEIKMPSQTGTIKIFSTVRNGKLCVVYVDVAEAVFKVISVWWRN